VEVASKHLQNIGFRDVPRDAPCQVEIPWICVLNGWQDCEILVADLTATEMVKNMAGDKVHLMFPHCVW